MAKEWKGTLCSVQNVNSGCTRGVLQFIGVARIFDWGGPNHKSHAMTSSKIFKKGTFCGAKIAKNGGSQAVAWWHVTRILVKGEGKN